MKAQFCLILTLISSVNLFAVTTAGTLGEAKTEKVINIKKKPVKKFFQDMTQRVLEKKIARKLEKKLAKEKRGRNFLFGLLSLISCIIGMASIFAAIYFESFGFVVFAVAMGVAGFILGLIGAFTDENKVMSTIGITLGTIFFFMAIGLIISLF